MILYANFELNKSQISVQFLEPSSCFIRMMECLSITLSGMYVYLGMPLESVHHELVCLAREDTTS